MVGSPWLAANTDAGVRRAARLGDAWLMNPHTTVAAGAPFLDAKYGAYRRSWEQDKALPADDAWSARFDDLARDRFVLGDPVRVREEIARYRERLGITT